MSVSALDSPPSNNQLLGVSKWRKLRVRSLSGKATLFLWWTPPLKSTIDTMIVWKLVCFICCSICKSNGSREHNDYTHNRWQTGRDLALFKVWLFQRASNSNLSLWSSETPDYCFDSAKHPQSQSNIQHWSIHQGKLYAYAIYACSICECMQKWYIPYHSCMVYLPTFIV